MLRQPSACQRDVGARQIFVKAHELRLAGGFGVVVCAYIIRTVSTAMRTESMSTIEQLESQRDQILRQLAAIGDFRPGNLTRQRRKCGSPRCHCAQPDSPGHPGWRLTRKVRGGTVTRGIPKAALQETRDQIDEYQRFQSLARELTEVSEALCDARVKTRRGKKKLRLPGPQGAGGAAGGRGG